MVSVVLHPSVLICFCKSIIGCINPKTQTQIVEICYLHGLCLTFLILLASIFVVYVQFINYIMELKEAIIILIISHHCGCVCRVCISPFVLYIDVFTSWMVVDLVETITTKHCIETNNKKYRRGSPQTINDGSALRAETS